MTNLYTYTLELERTLEPQQIALHHSTRFLPLSMIHSFKPMLVYTTTSPINNKEDLPQDDDLLFTLQFIKDGDPIPTDSEHLGSIYLNISKPGSTWARYEMLHLYHIKSLIERV